MGRKVGKRVEKNSRGSQLKRISYTCPRIDSGIPNQNQESLKMTPEFKNDSRIRIFQVKISIFQMSIIQIKFMKFSLHYLMNFLKEKFQFWIGVVSQILYTWQIVTARGTSLIEIIRLTSLTSLTYMRPRLNLTFHSSFNVNEKWIPQLTLVKLWVNVGLISRPTLFTY